MAPIKSVGPDTVCCHVKSLRQAAKAETSPIVVEELLKTGVIYQDLTTILNALEAANNALKTSTPDRGMFDAVTQALKTIDPMIKSAPAADKMRAATIVAQLASSIAQKVSEYSNTLQQAGNDLAQRVLPGGCCSTIDAAVKLLNSAAGKPISWGSSASPVMNCCSTSIYLRGRKVSLGQMLQKAMPGVPMPVKIIGK